MSLKFAVIAIGYLAASISESNCIKNAGPVKNIKIDSLEIRPTDLDEELCKLKFNILDDDSREVGLLECSLPFDVTNDFEYILIADKWNNGQWEKESFKINGAIFDDADQLFPDLYQHLRDQTEPKIEGNYLIPKGDYKLEHFKDLASSLKMDQIFYGRFIVHLQIFNGEELVLHFKSELDSYE